MRYLTMWSCQSNLGSGTARGGIGLLFSLLAAMILSVVCQPVSRAQAVSWQKVDIGSPSTAGTYTYASGTPPTYTVAGSGQGVQSTLDQMNFTSSATAGNIEIEGQLVSQSSATSGAFSGLMMRGSYDTNATMAAIGVKVGSGITFYHRVQGSGAVTVAGPSTVAPVYLRLVRAGSTISGYYSTDNETWNLVGSVTTTAIPNLYYVGFSVASKGTALNTAVFNYLTYATSVPQQTASLKAWYRSDVGVTSSGGAVSAWADQSGNSLNATQSTGTLQPTLTTGAINSGVLSAITFDGTSQYMSIGSDFSDMTQGASLFLVLKPTSTSGTGDPCAFGNASNSDAIFAQTIGQNASMSVYNSTTASSVTTTSAPLSNTAYQLLEMTFAPGTSPSTGVGTIWVGGSQIIQSTSMVENMNNISRTQNFIGVGISLANYFQGGIAELLVYTSPLTDSQRHALESYVLSKYGIGSTPTLDAPTISPQSGLVTAPLTVSITQDQGATCWYSNDGTTPSSSAAASPWVTAVSPTVLTNQTIKAIASAPFFNNSSATSATYQIDQDTLPVSRTGLALWLRADSRVTTGSGGKVSTWGDSSGLANDATQGTSGDQPTLVADAINGQPAVSFNGSSDFLQLATGMADFSSGASVFAVIKPTAVSAGARLFDFGNGAASDNIYVDQPTSTGASLYTFNGSSSTSVTSSSAITLGQFQLLEAVDNGTGTATVYTNSVQGAQNTSMNTMNNIARTLNYIGQGAAGGNYFQGQIAELIIYQRGLSTGEQAALEGYLLSRYQLLSANSTAAPTISVAGGTLFGPTQVAIEAPSPAEIFYTTDGSTPVAGSSPVYSQPLNVYYSQTVKAIAVVNGISSSVASATYTLDSTKWPAPASTTTPLKIQMQLPQVSIPQDSNQH